MPKGDQQYHGKMEADQARDGRSWRRLLLTVGAVVLLTAAAAPHTKLHTAAADCFHGMMPGATRARMDCRLAVLAIRQRLLHLTEELGTQTPDTGHHHRPQEASQHPQEHSGEDAHSNSDMSSRTGETRESETRGEDPTTTTRVLDDSTSGGSRRSMAAAADTASHADTQSAITDGDSIRQRRTGDGSRRAGLPHHATSAAAASDAAMGNPSAAAPDNINALAAANTTPRQRSQSETSVNARAAVRRPRQTPQVWWFAPFFSSGGYATEARDAALGLHADAATGHDNARLRLRITQHGDSLDDEAVRGLPRRDYAGLELLRATRVEADEAIVVCHSEPGAWQPALFATSPCPPDEEPAYSIGRTMFETDRAPHAWVERCRGMDEIWVPTAFNRETFVAAGVPAARVRIVPEAVDTDFFDPAAVQAPLSLPLGERLLSNVAGEAGGLSDVPAGWQPCPTQSTHTAATTTFLSIFKWEERKGWRLLLEAFVRAFTGRCDVMLQLVTSRFHMDTDVSAPARTELGRILTAIATEPPTGSPGVPLAAENASLASSPRYLPPIYVLDGHLPTTDMPRLYAAVDAFVLPSHGEGFGRPHVEAMSMGLPVIATNWSGVTAYLTPEVGYPLAITGLVTVPTGPYRHRHRWAMPSLTHLQTLLVHVATHPDEARARGRHARQLMERNFSRHAIAELLVTEFERIQLHLEDEGEL